MLTNAQELEVELVLANYDVECARRDVWRDHWNWDDEDEGVADTALLYAKRHLRSVERMLIAERIETQ